MVTVEEQSQQISQARQQLEAQRQAAEQARQQLEQARSRLPRRTSQTALRGQLGGLQGRQQQYKIQAAEQNIAAKQAEVSKFEEQLKPYEQQIGQAESQLSDYQRTQEAQKNVERAISQGMVGALAIYGTGKEQELAQQYVTQQRIGIESAEYLSKNPEILTEKVNILISKGLTEESAYKKLGFVLDTPKDNKLVLEPLVSRKGTEGLPPIEYNKPSEVTGTYTLAPKKNIVQKGIQAVSNIFYDVTGQQTPKEVVRTAIGSSKDISQPLTIKEVVIESAKIPLKATSILGGLSEVGTTKTISKVAPEFGGINIKTPELAKVNIVRNPRMETIQLTPQVETIDARPSGSFNIFTPSQIGKTANIGTQVGLFYAAGTSKVAGKVLDVAFMVEGGQAVLSKDTTTPQKVFGLAEAGFGAYGLAKPGINIVKREIKTGEFNQYFSSADLKVTTVETRTIYNPLEDQAIIKPRVTVSNTPEQINLNIIPKKKGNIKVEEGYPTSLLSGTVEETRQISKGISISLKKGDSFLSNKIVIGRIKPKQFTGEVQLGKNSFKESVDFGKYRRVTEVTGGEGEMILINKETGNIVAKQKVTKPSDNILDLKTKSKVNKVKIDKTFEQPYIITESGGKKVISTREGEQVLFIGKPKGYSPNLQTSKLTGEFTTDITATSSLDKGITTISSESYGYSDIIKVGERKGKLEVTTPKGTAVLKKRVGQTIEFGKDTDIDIVRTMSGEKGKVSMRVITPNIERQIAESSGTSIVQIEAGSKLLKEPRRLAEIQKTEAKRLAEKTRKLNSEWTRVSEKVEKPVEVLKISKEVEKARPQPLYVGGAGGEESISLYALESKSQFNPGTTIKVPETEQYLKGFQPSEVSIPRVVGTGAIDINKAGVSSTIVSPRSTIKEYKGLGQSISIKESVSTPSSEKSFEELKLDSISMTKVNQPSRVTDLANVKFSQPSQSRELQRFESKEALKFKSALSSIQEQKNIQTTKKITEVVRTEPRVPKKPTPIIKPTSSGVKVVSKSKVKPEEDTFEVFTKKAGKDISIGKTTSGQKAKELLVGELKGTLRASGYITKQGSKIETSRLGLVGGEFTTGKKEGYRLVQKRGFRLGTTGERREIKSAKSKKRSIFGL